MFENVKKFVMENKGFLVAVFVVTFVATLVCQMCVGCTTCSTEPTVDASVDTAEDTSEDVYRLEDVIVTPDDAEDECEDQDAGTMCVDSITDGGMVADTDPESESI